MQVNVIAPKTSLTAREVTVIEWLKMVGDKVKADEVLLTLETEKATVEVRSPGEGVLSSIVIQVGETAEVASVLATIDAEVSGSVPHAPPEPLVP